MGALGQLLLVAALAFGIFSMHTMGHPDSSSGSAMTHASHTAATSMSGEADHGSAGAAGMTHMEAAGHAATSPDASPPTHGAGMSMDMDMLSLCVAVLFGVGALATLLRSALVRHREWLPRLLAQVVAVLRPDPPPRGPDLIKLSVLRL